MPCQFAVLIITCHTIQVFISSLKRRLAVYR